MKVIIRTDNTLEGSAGASVISGWFWLNGLIVEDLANKEMLALIDALNKSASTEAIAAITR